MPYFFPKNQPFDINHFVQSLMREMGFDDEDPAKKEILENQIKAQLTGAMLNAISLHTEPEVMQEVMEQYKDEKDGLYIIHQLVRFSPSAQVAILEALDKFYDETLAIFNTIKS